MFNDRNDKINARMRYLEQVDTRDRIDGTARMQRLRQIPPETGRFLAIMAALAPDGEYLEIGTSAGYSTLWISLGCSERKINITTIEMLEEKIKIAETTFETTDLSDSINLIHGNALELLEDYKNIAFCFIDAEKEDYFDLYELIIPRLTHGGILIADNIISHADTLSVLVDRAEQDERVDSVVIPIGKGELLCRKI